MSNMPPALAGAASIYYTEQAKTARAGANNAQRIWRNMQGGNFVEKINWWNEVAAPGLAQGIRQQQAVALERTANYLAVTSLVQGIEDYATFDPQAFIYEQEPLEEALTSPMAYYVDKTIKGVPETVAHQAAAYWLTREVASAIQDVGRDATSAVILGSPGYDGYYRKLALPSCSRCAVLAGKYFDDNAGFDRHPECDCVHVPAGEAYDDATTDPVEAIRKGQVTGLSKGDQQAILENGADVSQVINAKSGLTTESVLGHKVQATTVGKTKRSIAGARSRNFKKVAGKRYMQSQDTRLSVSQIMKFADGDKALAERLLFKHGYLI